MNPAAENMTKPDIPARTIEESLKIAEEEKALILNSTSDLVAYHDLDLKVRWANLMAGTSVNEDPENLKGRYCYEIWHQRTSPCLDCPVVLARDTGQPQKGEIRSPDGREWYIRGYPIKDANGQVVALAEFSLDISELRRVERVREATFKISQAAISVENLDDLYRSIHQILGELMPVDNFFIALYDPTLDLFSYPYYVDQFDESPAPEKPGRGLTGYVLRTGRVLLAPPDVFDELVNQGEVELVGTSSLDWLGVPLRAKNRIIGVMAVQSYTEHVRYGEKEREIMEFVSTQVGMAIERKRAFEETRQHLQRLNALHEIDMAITANPDLRLTLNVLLNQMINLLGVDAADILILNLSTQMLEYAAGHGFRSTPFQRANLPLHEGYSSQVVVERAPLYIPKIVESREQFDPALQLTGEGFMAYYGMPLISKGQIKGVLEVFQRSPLKPDPGWLNFLEALGAQAAIAIDNASLFDALQRSNQELTVAYDATLEGWSRALELRDQVTEGHTRRVTRLTLRLAKLMGMSDAELVHVRRGALLHDIGKMAVSDKILQKPGPLSEEERKIMQKHPIYAFEMLYPITYLRPALDIPYRHHEKWDGSGYPRGLKGEQIPLAARVFAVVDVWDALNSDRPYRKAWPEEEALEYIRSQAGTYFEARIVEVFLNILNER
jgi:putative nucleotidyltransferase with HDIG domain